MINVRAMANAATQTVNPNEMVTILRSTGSTVGRGGKQQPSYDAPVTGPAQIQALDSDDLKQLEGMNIQGVIRAIYLRGVMAGVIQPKQEGGDLVKRNNETETWLVTKVLETWPTWTKAVIVLQSVEVAP